MEKYLNDMVNSLQWLIRIDSVGAPELPGMPFGEGCAQALQFTLSLCKSMGFKVKDVDGYAGHADIGSGEVFAILAHLDTVPHGEGWDYPPTGAVIDNGYLYGRGTMDDKGPLIASLYAVKALLDEGLTPKKKIRFIFGLNEETGWKCMDYYFKHEEMPPMGFSPDADFPVINCEKGLVCYEIKLPAPDGILSLHGGLRSNMVPEFAEAVVAAPPVINSDAAVIRFEKGYKISTSGKASHASLPERGENALWKLFDILAAYGGAAELIKDKLTAFDGSKCSLKLSDEKSGSLTMNLGTAELKDGIMTLTLDIRHPVSYTKEEIMEVLKNELPSAEISVRNFHKPLYVDPSDPLVTSLLEAYNKVTGKTAQPITIGGGTYARALPLGVAFGPLFPGQESTIHCKNERIALDDLLKMSKIYYEAIKSLCF
jgi:succinyl-diaminopimelate desuccinylase